MLHVNNLTVRIAGRKIIDRASFALRKGSKTGLVGRNGCGKSTLFRAIIGELPIESGEVALRPGARLGSVDQEAPGGAQSAAEQVQFYDQELTELPLREKHATSPEEIAQIQTRLYDIEAHTAASRAASILSGLGFSEKDQSRACSEFSGGWRMRIALAGMLFAQPDLLLLDEPSNYLDLEGVVWLENHLRSYRRTLLLISHDRDLLNAVPGQILYLRQGKTSLWNGGYDQFEKARAEKLRLDLSLKAKQDAQARHLQSFVDRFRYKESKARQAQSRLKRLAKMTPILVEKNQPVPPFLFTASTRKLASPLIRFEKVAVGYDPEKPVLSGIELRLDHDDRIALLGRNGAGKSTFAKLVAGKLSPQTGNIFKHKRLEIGWFAQHQLDALHPQKTAYDHICEMMPEATEAQKRAMLGQFGLSVENADLATEKLSGGEKARLLLNLIAFSGPHILILDEPTNHLDMESCEALIHALLEYPGAVILISHDRRMVELLADRYWIACDGGLERYKGDLTDYRSEILRGNKQTAEKANDRKAKALAGGHKAQARRHKAELRAQLDPYKKRVALTEKELEIIESRMNTVDEWLGDPNNQGDLEAQKTKSVARARLLKEYAQAEEKWLDAAQAYEDAKVQLMPQGEADN